MFTTRNAYRHEERERERERESIIINSRKGKRGGGVTKKKRRSRVSKGRIFSCFLFRVLLIFRVSVCEVFLEANWIGLHATFFSTIFVLALCVLDFGSPRAATSTTVVREREGERERKARAFFFVDESSSRFREREREKEKERK